MAQHPVQPQQPRQLLLQRGRRTTEAAASGIDNKDIKIGVSIWSSTDVLGSQCKLILDEAAKALGVQVQYVDQGHVSEKVTASVEQLAAAGCQGIIICNSSDTEMTSAIKTCNDKKGLSGTVLPCNQQGQQRRYL